ncbi:cob(I)yrinic acid a,c-diamide adenosyltransferase [Comamonas sp. JC664]|uniref:cob(I)yrinic acid a,c-diamide adenosyltransferase n=1 Tax=Comamonas sp. JC664 TaxID=2801917 RepID=UPI00361696ED
MKVPTARFGEHRLSEKVGLPVEGLGDGFSWKAAIWSTAPVAREGWEKAQGSPSSRVSISWWCSMRSPYPLIYGWLPLQEVLDAPGRAPQGGACLHHGRRCPQEIIDAADTVTEMTMIKHAFKAGIPAQRGIETEARAAADCWHERLPLRPHQRSHHCRDSL